MINQYLVDDSISELAFGLICTECAKNNQLSMFSSSQKEPADFEEFCSSMEECHELSLTPKVKRSSPSQLEVSSNNVKNAPTGKHYSRPEVYEIILNIFLQNQISQMSLITVSSMLQLTQQEVTLVRSVIMSQKKGINSNLKP